VIKTLARWALALGFIPVVIDDSRVVYDAIRRDMKILGLRCANISRPLGVSENLIAKYVSGRMKGNKYIPVIQEFIAKRKIEMLRQAQHDKGKHI
jgi:hypothetical protein